MQPVRGILVWSGSVVARMFSNHSILLFTWSSTRTDTQVHSSSASHWHVAYFNRQDKFLTVQATGSQVRKIQSAVLNKQGACANSRRQGYRTRLWLHPSVLILHEVDIFHIYPLVCCYEAYLIVASIHCASGDSDFILWPELVFSLVT